MASNINLSFNKGEIVWAKVEGFPWWPGQIKKIKKKGDAFQNIYHINFIGHSSYVILPISKIDKFEEKFEKHSKTKKQNLKLYKSIQKAKKMNELIKNTIFPEINEDEPSSFDDSIILSNSNEIKENKYLNKKVKLNQNYRKNKTKKDKGINTINSGPDIFSNSKNVKINININLTNNNNNTVISNFNLGKHNILEKKSEKERDFFFGEEEGILENKKKLIEEKEENNINNKIKNIMNNLLKYQIEIPNNHIHLSIMNELNNLNNEFIKNQNNNIYSLIKDIVPILNSLLYNKYDDIVDKSNEILFYIIQRVIDEIFLIEEPELNKLEENIKYLDINLIHKEIIKLFPDKEQKSLRTKIKKIHENKINQDISLVKNNSSENLTLINELFEKFINQDDLNAKSEINLMIKDFYNNIYNKNNNLNNKNAILRKKICIKLLHLLKQILPKIDEDDLKKTIIFLEYKIRCEDPDLGEKYIKQIKMFFEKMKYKLNKIKNIF